VPTRSLLRRQRNARVLLANADRVDVGRRVVLLDGGRSEVAYDYLLVATGARHSYFGHPEWEPLAPGLKTLDDARGIRRRFLLAFEDAEKIADPAEQAALLTFVVIGAGPTGVELAGILPTLARHGFRGDFRGLDPARARVILLEAGPRVLPTFPQRLSDRARRDLEDLGVEVRTGSVVTGVTADGVAIGDERIEARTVFWAAGNAASPLIRSLGTPLDRVGRALVEPDLSLPGRPEVFVVGDAAAAAMPGKASAGTPPGRPEYVPGLAAAANQMGAHAARMIVRTMAGQPRRPFRYRDKGSLAIIGRNRAVADFGRFRLTGFAGFLTWFFVHILYLTGFRNRLSAVVEWGYAYLTNRPGARLITEEDRRLAPPTA
jgi:NADH dehydrogenase